MQREVDEDFARYVRARQRVLLRAAYLVCGDARVAEDLVQQAFTRLALRWHRLRTEDPDAYVRRFLYRDAVAACRRARHESIPEVLPEVLPTADGRDGRAPVPDPWDVRQALATLTPRQRAVVVLRCFEDRSEADTAEVLGVPVGAVTSQLGGALAALREHLPDLVPGLGTGGHP